MDEISNNSPIRLKIHRSSSAAPQKQLEENEHYMLKNGPVTQEFNDEINRRYRNFRFQLSKNHFIRDRKDMMEIIHQKAKFFIGQEELCPNGNNVMECFITFLNNITCRSVKRLLKVSTVKGIYIFIYIVKNTKIIINRY